MNPDPSDRLPRLLLVEDDPVSAAFLHDAASALPADVQVAASLAEARRAIDSMHFDLWLVDANLPDGRGETMLEERRDGTGMPALAHTAASDAAARERLLASGFAEVLHKPIGVGALHAALRRHLPTPAGDDRARTQWDDAAALRAMGGDPAHVAALRGLFLQELPGQRQRIHAAADAADESAMRAELHRLAASCGFVGAAGLAAAVRDLQASPLQPEALHRFDAAADELLG